ncbi:MAG: FKBP-type peptidyl-prolyl cis-trans isomerase [Bacteroidales bacterium]|nr:FKBP-type peptidyl-prolyl cis-trans isomerase [Bacteroidales bacterium]HOI32376.1 FKBP-type peptidyl-prolyl cis-trans isomerase [Bacteroidales bacterium]
MKNLIISVFVILLIGSSCKEKQVVNQDDVDKQLIINYLEENNITAESTASGLFYVIRESGNERHPSVTSTITVSYAGRLLNGQPFDQGSFYTNKLNLLIKGWQHGLPLIGEGGKITLYVPSGLGYGSQSLDKIPANSVLIFDISLHYFSD